MKLKLTTDTESSELFPTISFPIIVNGLETTATIFGIGHHPIFYQYFVRFSDEFEDIFTLIEDDVEPATKEGTKYAQALIEDFSMLNSLTPDSVLWHLRYNIAGEVVNVWVKENYNDGALTYTVHYKGDYRFSVFVEDYKWVSRATRQIDPEPVNEELAKEVIKILDKEHLAVPFGIV